MPEVITTCGKCGSQYLWNNDYQDYPDCPNCGYNGLRDSRAKRDQCCSVAERGDLALLKRALSDPDIRRNLQAGPLTILHHAVMGNQPEIVK